MEIPDSFAIPDFITDFVKVAPDNWPEANDPSTARGRLQDLTKCLQSPDILFVIGELALLLGQIESEIDSHKFIGLHDVFIQQQLIGEKRGLRQFFSSLQRVHTALKSKLE